jgi:hypothetical protein
VFPSARHFRRKDFDRPIYTAASASVSSLDLSPKDGSLGIFLSPSNFSLISSTKTSKSSLLLATGISPIRRRQPLSTDTLTALSISVTPFRIDFLAPEPLKNHLRKAVRDS